MTPSSADLTVLLVRVEAAEGADRELFLTLAEALLPDYRVAIEWRISFNGFVGVEAWTDAALALCERVLPERRVQIDIAASPDIKATAWIGPPSAEVYGLGHTAPLALLAACLKALIAHESPSK